MKRPLAAMLAMATSHCSSTTYVGGPAVAAPPIAPLPPITAPPPSGSGRVLLDAASQGVSVLELREHAEPRFVCAATPCAEDVTPGVHHYRLLPAPASMIQVSADGNIASKDGIYSAPVDVDVAVTDGKILAIRGNLGQTEVHRSFPIGRGVAIGLMAAGVVLSIVGAAGASSAPSGSPDAQIEQGWLEIGLGTMALGVALLSFNLRDNLSVAMHAGTSTQQTSSN